MKFTSNLNWTKLFQKKLLLNLNSMKYLIFWKAYINVFYNSKWMNYDLERFTTQIKIKWIWNELH